MTAHVGAVRSVLVRRSAERTLEIVRDIELLEPLERKARSVEVHPETDLTGWYRIVGRLARVVPWEGVFSFRQHDVGWHSTDLVRRPDGWQICGGFVVTPINEQLCRVIHYEDYELPERMTWMRWPLRFYMRASQVGELRDLVRLIEKEP